MKVRTVTQHAKHETDHVVVIVVLVVEAVELPIITIERKGCEFLDSIFRKEKEKISKFSVLAVVQLDHVNHQKQPMSRVTKHQNEIIMMNVIVHRIAIETVVIVIETVTIDRVIEFSKKKKKLFSLLARETRVF